MSEVIDIDENETLPEIVKELEEDDDIQFIASFDRRRHEISYRGTTHNMRSFIRFDRAEPIDDNVIMFFEKYLIDTFPDSASKIACYDPLLYTRMEKLLDRVSINLNERAALYQSFSSELDYEAKDKKLLVFPLNLAEVWCLIVALNPINCGLEDGIWQVHILSTSPTCFNFAGNTIKRYIMVALGAHGININPNDVQINQHTFAVGIRPLDDGLYVLVFMECLFRQTDLWIKRFASNIELENCSEAIFIHTKMWANNCRYRLLKIIEQFSIDTNQSGEFPNQPKSFFGYLPPEERGMEIG